MSVPEHWTVERLDSIAEVRLGRQRSPKNHTGSSMRSYLRAANVGWDGLLLDDVKQMNFSDAEMTIYRLEQGDILLGEASGSPHEVGKPALWRDEIPECAFQNTLIRVRAHRDLPEYLTHYFRYQALSGAFAAGSHGVGIHHLSRARLASWMVPLPPVSEQRRIVGILEDHLSHLDAAEALLTAASRRRAAWAAATLDQAALGSSEGMAPLASLVDRIEAGRSFGGPAPAAAEDEWGIIKVSAMTWGEFRPAENKRVPDDLANPAFEIKAGDLLVSRANTSAYVGAPVLVRVTRPRLLLSDKSLRLIPKAGVDTEWLAAVLASRSSRSQISKIATGTSDSMRNISQKSLLSIAVPSASVKQQRTVIDAVRANQEAEQRLDIHVDEAISRSANLRRAILAAAFAGRLTGRSADTDVIEELASA